MGDYRHIETGEVKTQGAWRSHYKNVSLPRTWTAATLDGLKLEPVFETPKPRQALRDITDHVSFPHLQDADWPAKPE
jgi:hypothetical protein